MNFLRRLFRHKLDDHLSDRLSAQQSEIRALQSQVVELVRWNNHLLDYQGKFHRRLDSLESTVKPELHAGLGDK
jgi:hypothetical protein